MLIYKKNHFLYCFIHIPKTNGKEIKKKIKSESTIVQEFSGCKKYFDYTHISYSLRNKFCKYDRVLYHTYVRNPYQRLIDSYFTINPINTISDFRLFIKMFLKYYDFSNYNYLFLYYYPCYFFVYETLNKKPNDIIIQKFEDHNTNVYDLNQYYDKECILIINKIYSKDFELFNYTKL